MPGENECSLPGFLERPEVFFSGEGDEFFDLSGLDNRGSPGKDDSFPEDVEGFPEHQPGFSGRDSEASFNRFLADQTVPPGKPEVAFRHPPSQGHQEPKRKDSDDKERKEEAEVSKIITDALYH